MIKNKKLFLDANILLEIILDRPLNKQCRMILEQNVGNLYISALTAHLVVHFGASITDIKVIKQFLDDYYVESLEYADFEWAYNNGRDKDFEDALQIAIAVRMGADTFVSLDKKLVKTYKDLPILNFKLVNN